jgi:hypothetical protein
MISGAPIQAQLPPNSRVGSHNLSGFGHDHRIVEDGPPSDGGRLPTLRGGPLLCRRVERQLEQIAEESERGAGPGAGQSVSKRVGPDRMSP